MDYMVTKTIAEPTNATGVPVTLQAVDPNGNVINLGTVTSDQNGIFKQLWTPEIAGEYTINATSPEHNHTVHQQQKQHSAFKQHKQQQHLQQPQHQSTTHTPSSAWASQ